MGRCKILCKIGGLYCSLGDKIQKMINSFWWDSNSGGNRGIHWLSWEKLSQPMKVKDISTNESEKLSSCILSVFYSFSLSQTYLLTEPRMEGSL